MPLNGGFCCCWIATRLVIPSFDLLMLGLGEVRKLLVEWNEKGRLQGLWIWRRRVWRRWGKWRVMRIYTDKFSPASTVLTFFVAAPWKFAFYQATFYNCFSFMYKIYNKVHHTSILHAFMHSSDHEVSQSQHYRANEIPTMALVIDHLLWICFHSWGSWYQLHYDVAQSVLYTVYSILTLIY